MKFMSFYTFEIKEKLFAHNLSFKKILNFIKQKNLNK